MKNFRVELTKNWENGKTTVYIGKYTIDENGYIKGFLKAEKDKSYIIGLKDKQGNISFIQVWARTNGDLEWPDFPIKYSILNSSNECVWEQTDSIYDQEFYYWKKGYEGYENFNFAGTASIDIKEIPGYPLTERENRIISNILNLQSWRIKNIFNLDSESFRVMKANLSQ